MDPNSFRGKVLLSIFDKLIVGAIAFLVVMWFQNKSAESRRLLDEKLAVSSIQTEIIVEQKKNIIQNIKEYSLLVEQIKKNGRRTPPQTKQLSKFKTNLDEAVTTLCYLDSSFVRASSGFTEVLQAMQLALTGTPAINADKITAEQTRLAREYFTLLNEIGILSRKTVRKEFEEAKE